MDFIRKTAPGRYATADAVADEAAAMALEGLTTEFTTANLLDLATVDAERLSAAYSRFVTGDWTVVVVGDAGALRRRRPRPRPRRRHRRPRLTGSGTRRGPPVPVGERAGLVVWAAPRLRR